MEVRLNFMKYLDTDMVVNIMSRLDDQTDLVNATVVSRYWRDFVLANGFCKQLCLRKFPQLANVANVTVPNQVKKSNEFESSIFLKWEALEREHRVYAAFLQAVSKVKATNCVSRAFCASSTDRYPQESIIHTLGPRNEMLQRFSYWSSKGEINPDVPETLIYKLRAAICVVTDINIRPFQAYFQPNHPIYSAKYVRFRMGHPRFQKECDKLVLPLEQNADEKIIWTYTSPVFPMSQESVLQNFKLPEPVLCIGGYVQLEMSGRIQTQQTDERYYICVSHVQIVGRPLGPAFDVDIIEPCGKFSLKYFPEALPKLIWSTSDPLSPNVNASRPSPEERVWEHLEDLVEFLLRRHELGERIESDDDDDVL